MPRALLGLMLVALLARLAIWPWFDGIEPKIYDEDDYVDIAVSLAERGEFAMGEKLTTARPPLYPAMVAGVYRIAGVGNHQAVRLLQILLNVATLPLVFFIGRRLYDERTGLLAAALAAFYPSLWGHDYLVLTEVLFTFLLVAGVWALIESGARQRWALLVLAGIVFGLGALTRTSLLFYPPLFAIAMFGWSRAPSPRRIAAVLIFTAAFAVTIAPWIARNTRLQGRLSSIDAYSNTTAAKYSPLRHLFEKKGSTWATRHHTERDGAGDGTLADAKHPERKRLEAERQLEARTGLRGYEGGVERPAATSLGGNVLRAAYGVAWDSLLFWRIDREIAGAAARGWLGPLPRAFTLLLTAGIALYYVLLALAGVFGMTLRPPPDRLHLAILLSTVVVLFGVHAFSVGHSRYHLPLVPLIAVFAARLWVARGEPVTRRRATLGLTLASVLIASWVAAIVRFDLRDARQQLDRKERRPAVESRID